jgi:hypothetical protein
MTSVAEKIEDVIVNTTREILSLKTTPEIRDYTHTDNMGEVIEKLVILHIRMWMLEDAAQNAKTDQELADIKRKIDICFKQKRPKFVQAINVMIDESIINGKSLVEDSVKLYKGIN